MQESIHAYPYEMIHYKIHGVQTLQFNLNFTIIFCGKMEKQVFWLNKQVICYLKILQLLKANLLVCNFTKQISLNKIQLLETLQLLENHQETLLSLIFNLMVQKELFYLEQDQCMLKILDSINL